MAIRVISVAPLLQVYDMPTALHFYRDTLGFEIVSSSPTLPDGSFHWTLLKLGPAELMLNTAYESHEERPSSPDPARTAAHQDTCLYFACPDVDTAFTDLRARGVAVKQPVVAPYHIKQMYLSDPDGYNLCFQWPA